MIHQIVLCRLHPDLAAGGVDDLMRQTHAWLQKIPEFRTVTCGKSVGPQQEHGWSFYFASDFENLDKMRLGQRSRNHERFEREILSPRVVERQTLTYELEPGKEGKYS